ncbi:MAG: trypsin-like serine protease [Campylobacterales bacterium]|nr:trypsin-like serine protease [Campylobacterales bacterium]
MKIFTSSVKANYASPWTMSDQHSSTGSGVLIEGGLILTAAHVVSDQSFPAVIVAGMFNYAQKSYLEFESSIQKRVTVPAQFE